MISWILGFPLQYLFHLKNLDFGHLCAYHVMPEGVVIFMIKLDGLIGIMWNLGKKFLDAFYVF